MLAFQRLALAIAAAITFSSNFATAHEISWPRGGSRQVGFGHCAKGPCIKRTSFATSVPHRHLGDGQCEGKGAAGYTFGRRFSC
jgi:hypothetical protein